MGIELNKPQIITASYQIVTPMFIGDAEQKATGISPASVKGALRFWWRALNWGRIASGCQSESEALKQLHEEEGDIFGTVAGDGKGAAFTLRVSDKKLNTIAKNTVHPEFKEHDAARYLGYGVMEAFASQKKGTKAAQLTRSCIQDKQEFDVEIIFHHKVDESIIATIKALGLLGSLGSRARKGYGSVNIQSISGDNIKWNKPISFEEYQREVCSLLFPELSDVGFPPFTAFSSKTRIDSLMSASTSYLVLDQYAKSMLLYRSWGRNGKVLDQDSEKNFTKDHDWSKNTRPTDFHPERVIFGLPHNYGKEDHLAVTPEKPPKSKKSWHERRASPLFFHVHQIKSEYYGISIILPAQFLPKNEKINAGGINVPSKPDWEILTIFLDSNAKKDDKSRFPDKKNILKGESI